MKRLLLLSGAGTLASGAYAHVKWFVHLDAAPPADFQWYSFTDTAVQVWITLALLFISLSVYLDFKLPVLRLKSERWRDTLELVLRWLTGLSLLSAAIQGTLIAPHYPVRGLYGHGLLILEGVTAVMLLTPLARHAGMLLLVLFAGISLQVGGQIIEYLNVAGVGGYLLLRHWYSERRAVMETYAVPVLRIATGIALVWLGFSEKLLRPDFAQEFVQTYMWNFMYNLGVESFSDHLFVLSAGTMEVVFGIILILGTTTRLNILVVSGFMLTSNLAFFMEGRSQEALTEIIGHMPIIAIAVVCLAQGAGQHWTITSLLRRLRCFQPVPVIK